MKAAMKPVMALPMKAMKSMKAAKPAMKAAMKAAMKPAMKAAMKAVMKAKKAMKVSKIARGKMARAVVLRGNKEKTGGGLTKDQLVKSKSGKIVSKAASAQAKKAYAASPLKKWMEACRAARKQLNITGFVACGGKPAQGKAVYAKTESTSLGKLRS